MSVINDMLRDLDRRHGAQPVAPFGGVAVVVTSREWPWRIALIIVIFSALILGVYTLVASRLAHSTANQAVLNSVPAKAGLAQPAFDQNPSKLPDQENAAAIKSVVGIVAAESARTESAAEKLKQTSRPENAVAKDVAVAATEPVVSLVQSPSAEIVSSAPEKKAQLVKQLSQTPEALAEESYRLAMAALRHNARTDAERELNNTLSMLPNHVSAIAALARLYLEDARLDAAQQLLAPALAANIDSLELRQLLARTQLSLGHAQEAQQLLAARQPDLPTHTEYFAMQAALEQQLGHHAAAAQHYGELLNVDASMATWWLGLALALDKQQQNSDAAVAYRRALALNTLPIAARDFAQQRLSVLEGHS